MRSTCYLITRLKTLYMFRETAIVEVFCKNDSPTIIIYYSSGSYKIIDIVKNTKTEIYHCNYMKVIETIMFNFRFLLPKQNTVELPQLWNGIDVY